MSLSQGLNFLSTWDLNLAETVSQTRTSLQNPRNSDRLQSIIASFDLSALKSHATRTRASACTAAHFLTFGGYNIVYVLRFDDGTDVLARLRIPGNGFKGGDYSSVSEEDLAARFASEVGRIQPSTHHLIPSPAGEIATLRFVKKHTSIPVPQLYHWDSDPANPVGTRYMLIQRISAPVLAHVERDLSPASWGKIVAQIAHYEVQLLDNPLQSIGTLVDEHGTVGEIGPTCTAWFPLRDNRGPFKCSKDFLLAFVDSQLDLVTNRKPQWIAWRHNWAALNGGADSLRAEYATRWFQLLRDAIISLPDELHLQFPKLPPPVFRLSHTDFNEGNILISSAEDATIVAVLDWEGAQVLPSWDARHGCNVSWIPWDLLPDDQAAASQDLYLEATTQNDRWLPVGMSLLNFEGLLGLVDSSQSIMSSRADFDSMFLSWLRSAETTGGKWCQEILRRFRQLEEFIETYRDDAPDLYADK